MAASYPAPLVFLWAFSHSLPNPPSLSSSLLIPQGMGLAARIQEREKGRKGTIFSILSPPGKDWPSKSRGRKIVRRFPLFCSLSAGALQRHVLRGGEDQR